MVVTKSTARPGLRAAVPVLALDLAALLIRAAQINRKSLFNHHHRHQGHKMIFPKKEQNKCVNTFS
jgi:hypothetical protein